ncbi:MAG: hypothetical protein HRT35_32750 [Algicola sp.]|nr:hypothetical protein [Algicola sp.]
MIANKNNQPEQRLEDIIGQSADTSLHDMFLIDLEGDPIYITYQQYRHATQIGLKNDQHNTPCFVTEQGGCPPNLFGPVLTKVLPCNIAAACPLAGINKDELKPGYIVDLRMLEFTRLNSPFHKVKAAQNQPINPPTAHHKRQPISLKELQKVKEEIGEIPQNNLYVISWADLTAEHGPFRPDYYQINFISAEQLLKLKIKQPEINPQVSDYLSSYFTHAGVQLGTINPLSMPIVAEDALKDSIEQGADIMTEGLFCYVINLNSFNNE